MFGKNCTKLLSSKPTVRNYLSGFRQQKPRLTPEYTKCSLTMEEHPLNGMLSAMHSLR